MIYLKTYKQLNEGLRDKMLPKSVEDLKKLHKIEPLNLLILSAGNGYLKGVKIALKKGADVNIWDNHPLRYASKFGFYDIVKLLLDNGADVNANGNESLIWASEEGHVDIVQLLLDRGADVHAIGGLSLALAKKGGHNDVVKILQNHIAINEGLRDKMVGKSDEDIMNRYKKLDILKLLNVVVNIWVKYIYDAYTNPGYFSDYVKGVIGRDLLKEIEEYYKDTIDDEKKIYFKMKYLSPFIMISELELSKEELIKIIIQLHRDYN